MSKYDDGPDDDELEHRRPTQRAKRSTMAKGAPSGPRPAKFRIVPKGTPASTCTGHRKPGGSCTAEIYWIDRPRDGGRAGMVREPIDCDVEGGVTPDSLTDGLGVTHFSTCVDASNF